MFHPPVKHKRSHIEYTIQSNCNKYNLKQNRCSIDKTESFFHWSKCSLDWTHSCILCKSLRNICYSFLQRKMDCTKILLCSTYILAYIDSIRLIDICCNLRLCWRHIFLMSCLLSNHLHTICMSQHNCNTRYNWSQYRVRMFGLLLLNYAWHIFLLSNGNMCHSPHIFCNNQLNKWS